MNREAWEKTKRLRPFKTPSTTSQVWVDPAWAFTAPPEGLLVPRGGSGGRDAVDATEEALRVKKNGAVGEVGRYWGRVLRLGRATPNGDTSYPDSEIRSEPKEDDVGGRRRT